MLKVRSYGDLWLLTEDNILRRTDYQRRLV